MFLPKECTCCSREDLTNPNTLHKIPGMFFFVQEQKGACGSQGDLTNIITYCPILFHPPCPVIVFCCPGIVSYCTSLWSISACTRLFILLVQVAVLRGGRGSSWPGRWVPTVLEGGGGRGSKWPVPVLGFISMKLFEIQKQNLTGFWCFVAVLTNSVQIQNWHVPKFLKSVTLARKVSNATSLLKAYRYSLCLSLYIYILDSGRWLDKVDERFLKQFCLHNGGWSNKSLDKVGETTLKHVAVIAKTFHPLYLAICSCLESIYQQY